MSLSESFSDLTGKTPLSGVPLAEHVLQPPPTDPALIQLRESLAGIMNTAGEQQGEQPRVGRVYIFRGELLIDPKDAYPLLTERFRELGYTPMLQREDDEEVIVAIEGAIPQRRFKSRWWLHLGLLLVTLVTTTVMGAALNGINANIVTTAARARDWTTLRPILEDALPFSLTLLLILGVHEMGHYVAARLHGMKVTLPFFIPLPVSGSLGTMGAVIFIKSPLMNRRALFDVGLAGPIAGLIVALPLYLIGLHAEPTIGRPLSWMDAGIWRVANPPLLDWLARLVTDTNNLDRMVFFGHPMALAAWFGVLLTALNLLPLGQFDGGHVSYALFGRRAWPIALITFWILLGMGLLGAWFAWLVWAIMGLFTGLKHPPPFDDLSPLGWKRQVIGLATIALFFLIIVPVPFYGRTL